MAKLIDADKIVNGIALYMAENAYLNDTPLDALKMVANWITDASTVDAVEVVRCKDCKFWIKFESSLIGEVMCCTGQGAVNIIKQPDDFCSCGKRKEGGGNG